jgi:hypothetical protein
VSGHYAEKKTPRWASYLLKSRAAMSAHIVMPSVGGPHDVSNQEVTSCRVLEGSTREQGRSGLGLAAQRFEIEAFGVREGFSIESWHHDVQTGAGKDALVLRPGLAAALKEAGGAASPDTRVRVLRAFASRSTPGMRLYNRRRQLPSRQCGSSARLAASGCEAAVCSALLSRRAPKAVASQSSALTSRRVERFSYDPRISQ